MNNTRNKSRDGCNHILLSGPFAVHLANKQVGHGFDSQFEGKYWFAYEIIAAAMKVHSVLGPGLLESAYQACLVHELRKHNLRVASQVGLPVVYEDEKIDLGHRIDLVVGSLVIVEIKCVEAINPVHKAQLLSYMRLSGRQVGLLINFYVEHLKDGIKRIVCDSVPSVVLGFDLLPTKLHKILLASVENFRNLNTAN